MYKIFWSLKWHPDFIRLIVQYLALHFHIIMFNSQEQFNCISLRFNLRLSKNKTWSGLKRSQIEFLFYQPFKCLLPLYPLTQRDILSFCNTSESLSLRHRYSFSEDIVTCLIFLVLIRTPVSSEDSIWTFLVKSLFNPFT